MALNVTTSPTITTEATVETTTTLSTPLPSTDATFYTLMTLSALAVVGQTLLTFKLGTLIHSRLSARAQCAIYALVTSLFTAGVGLSAWAVRQVSPDELIYDVYLALCIYCVGALFPLALPLLMAAVMSVLYIGHLGLSACLRANGRLPDDRENDRDQCGSGNLSCPTCHPELQLAPSYEEVIARDLALAKVVAGRKLTGMAGQDQEEPPPAYHEVV